MINPSDDKNSKLRQLRRDFEGCIDHQREAQAEAHRAGRYYHNSECKGQWESGDLEYLRSQYRAAFTFNLIKPKLDQFVGEVKETQRRAEATPVGGEDAFTAEILNAITDRMVDMIDLDTKEAQTLRDSAIHGQDGIRLHAEPDSENPIHMKMRAVMVPGYELHWDSASRLPDRSDARFFFWDRWLSKWEFKKLYPKVEWDLVSKKADIEENEGYTPDWSEDDAMGNSGDETDMYDSGRFERYYYNRHKDMVRVIHAEYRIPERVYFAVNSETGMSEEISKGLGEKFQQMQEMGVIDPQIQVAKAWKDRVYNVQFVGEEVLFDDWLGEPFDGWSVVPFTFSIDSETGTAYGMIRNLFDPQMEVNKSHSLSLENLSAQSKPGVRAEEDAIIDRDATEEQERTPGGISIYANGALTQGKVQERGVAQMSSAVEQRLQNSVAMLDKISAVQSDTGAPAAQAEAAATVQLRYRQSLLAKSDAIDAYEGAQKGLKRRLIQSIVKGMPDTQIAEYLGNASKYQVQQTPAGTMVLEMDEATGQPKNQAMLQDIRTMRYDVTLEVSSTNTTLRLIEGQTMMGLSQNGFPVAPEVMIDKVVTSRADREKMMKYADEQAQAQAQSAQQVQEQQSQLMEATLQIEAGKAKETERHNMATEELTFRKTTGDHSIRFADVLQKADETEKRAVTELFKLMEKRQEQRGSIPADFKRG